ncbi:MAG: nucleoside-diphosphate sugar epimerase/dehydratase [Bacteroidales bacterium]|nr:polysaccharide biosynthesis protein [Bacteroidales bacterium]MDD4603054.1 nucleoside-diphosphate sugar epimerase/dehydratase [Bacteroidales bacterium]
MFLTRENTPRWLIFVIDVVIAISSVILAYLLRFNFSIPASELKPLPQILFYMVLVRSISFVIARSYAGIIRYTSTGDVLRVFATVLSGSLVFVLTNLITFFIIDHFFFIPFSIIIIDFLATSFGMLTFRLIVKLAFLEFQHPERAKVNVVIYGAGEAGIISKRTLDRDAGTKYKVLAFLDDNPSKQGKKLEGVDILSPKKIDNLLATNTISQIILSIQHFDSARKQALVDKCLNFKTKVLTVPPMIKWINGELSFKQIRKINIEELLEREEIKLDEHRISKELTGKVILITGASGSIGSEMVRQIARFAPKQLILIDQAETPLHYLELEYPEYNQGASVEIILCDICNETRMQKIFQTFRPEIVYHAAAYKHVPMMENNPAEAVLTNVKGTKIVADLAIAFGVRKFIMISTDKAVNPTNVMGASKRIAEIYTQALNVKNRTRFITTRFGNVLGSNGSVIPLFRSQIEKGGPITITHPEVTRFFMTIPESCRLVLEASAIGHGGEIFIFDMGNSVKILDLAKKMIQLSGLTLGKDIQIKYTGLRPGEKLYEELLNVAENTLPTPHPLITIAKVREYSLDDVISNINELTGLITSHSNFDIVRKMKQMVPEYKSQNSIYETLDSDLSQSSPCP